MAKAEYEVSDLKVLKGLDPVKERPGMYTDTDKPNHLAQEILDNSIDEALAGFGNEVTFTIFEDESIEVKDFGRGMPVEIHKEEGISGVELIMTKLHSGGKFDSDAYGFSGGLHGVGAGVVNGLSDYVEVTVNRNGKVYYIKFENGGEVTVPLKEVGKCLKKDTGTTVKFKPNAKYFDTTKIDRKRIIYLLKSKAILSPGLRINFIDKNNNDEQTWFFEDGIKGYMSSNISSNDVIPEDVPIYGSFVSEEDMMEAEWVLSWNLSEPSSLSESYVNLIPTVQGGTHVNGLRTGISEAIKSYCETHNLLPKNLKLSPEDSFHSLNFVLSFKMREASFAGQTKEKLSSREASKFCANTLRDNLVLWLNDNVSIAHRIAEEVIRVGESRVRKSKAVKRKKITSGPALPGKLADCSGVGLETSELFLVEGDSAGGSAKQARDKNFQAILPLRGKILNSWDMESDDAKVIGSNEIHEIGVAIGIVAGSDDISTLRYNKICVLADADSDGLHIATLLIALFVKHYPKLVAEGHIYISLPPLYKINIGKKTYYALDDEEREHILKRNEGSRSEPEITRFKGLGEMNPEYLRETVMSPDSRKLIQLTLNDYDYNEDIMSILMSKKRDNPERRKVFINENGDKAELE